jgi:hypothetical protein
MLFTNAKNKKHKPRRRKKECSAAVKLGHEIQKTKGCLWLLSTFLANRTYVRAALAFDAAFCWGLWLGRGWHVSAAAAGARTAASEAATPG